MNDNRISGKIENNKNLSIVQGSNNSVLQNYSTEKIDDMFDKWINEIKHHPDIHEKEVVIKDVEDVKSSVKSDKMGIAKKLFGALGTAVQTLSSALAIAQAFKWIP